MPPKDSHGEVMGASSVCSSWEASVALTGVGPLPPSM